MLNWVPSPPPNTNNAALERYIIEELRRLQAALAELEQRITDLEP